MGSLPSSAYIDCFAGKQLVFVTNNSTKSRADYKKKFDKLGIPAEVVRSFHPTPILSTKYATERSLRILVQRRGIHQSHSRLAGAEEQGVRAWRVGC